MKIIVNKKEMEVGEGCSVEQLVEMVNGKSVDNIAIAIGMKVIRKEDWKTCKLEEGDCVTLIRATCGG